MIVMIDRSCIIIIYIFMIKLLQYFLHISIFLIMMINVCKVIMNFCCFIKKDIRKKEGKKHTTT